MSSEDVKKLCTRLLNGHGGVGLGKSLLTSEDGERGGDNSGDPVGSSPSWCVCGKCREMEEHRMCLLQQKKLYYKVLRFFSCMHRSLSAHNSNIRSVRHQS